MLLSRKQTRALFFLLFLCCLYAKPTLSYEFDPLFIGEAMTREVSDGQASTAQFLELQQKAIENLANQKETQKFFTQNFEINGLHGELKSGKKVTDWEALGKLIGVSGILIAGAYGLWRKQRKAELELLQSGDIDQIEALLDKDFEEQSDQEGQLKNGEIITDWEDYAKQKGLAGMGGLFFTLYSLWRRKRKQLETPTPNFKEQENSYDVLQTIYEEAFIKTNGYTRLFHREVYRKVLEKTRSTEPNTIKDSVIKKYNSWTKSWYAFLKNRRISLQKEKNYEIQQEQETKTYVETIKNFGETVKQLLISQDVKRKAYFVGTYSQVLKSFSEKEIKKLITGETIPIKDTDTAFRTNLIETIRTPMNKGLLLPTSAATMAKNQVIEYFRKLFIAKDQSIYFDQAKTEGKDLLAYQETQSKLVQFQIEKTPAQKEIADLKLKLSGSNNVSWQEFVDRTPYLKYLQKMGKLCWATKDGWIRDKRYIGRSSNSYWNRKLGKYYGALARSRSAWSPHIENVLTQLSRAAHNESIKSYTGWSNYYKEHPIVWETKQKTWKTRLAQLEIAEKNRQEFLANQGKALNEITNQTKAILWNNRNWLGKTYEERKGDVLTQTIIKAEKETPAKDLSKTFLNNFNEKQNTFLTDQATRFNAYSPPRISLSSITTYNKEKYLGGMLRSLKFYATPRGESIRNSLYNDSNDGRHPVGNSGRAPLSTENLTASKRPETKPILSLKIKWKEVLSSITLSAQTKIEELISMEKTLNIGVVKLKPVQLKDNAAQTAIRYKAFLKASQKMSYEDREARYNAFWKIQKDDSTSLIINIAGFSNYIDKSKFSIDALTQEFRKDIDIQNTKIITLSHDEAGSGWIEGFFRGGTAIEEIKKTLGKNGKLILTGHSLGGDSALELAKALEKEGIDVDLMVTIDSVGSTEGRKPFISSLAETFGSKKFNAPVKVPSNIKNHINFWENGSAFRSSNPYNIKGSKDFYNDANIPFENIEKDKNHTEIIKDEEVRQKIKDSIMALFQ